MMSARSQDRNRDFFEVDDVVLCVRIAYRLAGVVFPKARPLLVT